MKRISCIILLMYSLIMATQTVSAQEQISLNVKNADLQTVIKQIEQQTNYRFIYGEEIRLKTPVTVKMEQASLAHVLSVIFRNQAIDYRFQSSHIILSSTFPKEQILESKKRHTISGYIYNVVSRETLIGANIYDEASGAGTATNEYGFYSLTVPAGKTKLRFTYIGFDIQTKELDLNQNTQLNMTLTPNKLLDEVIVYGDRSETGIRATQMGALDIPVSVIKNTPVLLGEADVLKAIQLMPGVQAGTEGSAGVYVRGGGSDENLILLDGIPLYNVDHVFGFFSVFTPEAIKKVSFFKGSFPSRFGGRLSSIIDVRTNDGDMRKFHGTIGIGLLSSKLQVEGPLIKDRTSFNVSARRSYIDLLAKPFMKKNEKFGFYFYDLNAKVNHRLNDRSRLHISLYNGSDKLSSDYIDRDEEYKEKIKFNLHWGNLLLAAKWNYQLSPQIFSNATLAYTKYKFNVNTLSGTTITANNESTEYTSKYTSGINNIAASLDFDYNPVHTHHIKFGAGYLNHHFRPEVQTSRMKNDEEGLVTDTVYNSLNNSKIPAHEANIYIEDDFKIGKKFDANMGFHLSLFHVDNKTYTSFQPRLSLRYQLNNDYAFKASYTQMSQYIHRLSSYTMTLPSDLWVPATPTIKPMQAHQYSLGAYYTGLKGWEFSVEGYYKDMRDVLEYKDGASFTGSSQNWEDKVEMGKGRAMGLEFMAQKTIGNTTGWLSYTLAKSDRKFSKEGINNGKRFPYRYDRRHHITAVFNHKFSDKIDISASWEFYTGGTTTIAEEKTLILLPGTIDNNNGYGYGYGSYGSIINVRDYQIKIADYIENRNNYRMPSSHRLNVGINFNKKTKHGLSTWNIGIYNVYNAMNPSFIYKSEIGSVVINQDGSVINNNHKSIIKKVTVLPIIPSITYTYKF